MAEEKASIEPYKSYLCYICNVNVPEKYYKQHNNSERHHIYKTLAGKFLENVAKQIDIDINTSNNYENDEFYCEICCTVVAEKHEQKHNESSYHLKSIENAQLTSKFLEMYISNKSPESDGETDHDSNSEVDSKGTIVLDEGALDTNILDTNVSETSVMNTSVFDNDTYGCEIVEIRTDNDCKSEVDSECTIVTETTILDDSVSDKNVLCNDIQKNNVVYRSTKDKSVFYNNVLYNIVSDTSALNTSASTTSALDTSAFDTGALDTSAFDTSAKDTSAFDTSACGSSELDTSNVIDTGSDGTYNDFVMVQVLTNIMKDNDKIISPPYKKDTTVRDFQMYLYEIIETYKLPANIPIFDDNLIVIVTPKGYREYISIDFFHGYSKNGDRIYCLLCQKWVQNYLKEHGLSQQHATLLMQPINDKFARILDARYSHCLLCNRRVLTDSDHTAISWKHRNYPEPIISTIRTYHEEPSTSTATPLSKIIPRKDKTLSKIIAYKKQFNYINEYSTMCLVCSIPVAPSRPSIIRHVEGIPHVNKCEILLKNNNMKQLSFELYYCNICNVNIEDFLSHINMHKEEKCDSGKGKNDKHMLKKYIYEDPLNDDPITKKYRQIYEEHLKRNKIVPQGESNFYCTVCHKKMTRISEIDHMFGDRHKYALSKNPNGS